MQRVRCEGCWVGPYKVRRAYRSYAHCNTTPTPAHAPGRHLTHHHPSPLRCASFAVCVGGLAWHGTAAGLAAAGAGGGGIFGMPAPGGYGGAGGGGMARGGVQGQQRQQQQGGGAATTNLIDLL